MVPPTNGPAGRVLIVDDQDLVREFCGRVLTCHGFEVMEADDGQQAIEMYRETQPDAVLLDVMMPTMDGITLLQELRRIDPNARVVMISGNKQEDIVKRALKLGARDYVLKPFHSTRLIGAVERLLRPAPQAHLSAGGVA